MHQVHLQQTGLQRTLCGAVVLQGIQEERSALLDQVILHKHIHDLYKKKNLLVNKRNTRLQNATILKHFFLPV